MDTEDHRPDRDQAEGEQITGRGGAADPGQPPPGPAPAPAEAAWGTGGQVRRLTRSSDDRVLAGVAGGLGAWLGVDPRALRVAFVVLTVFGGAGLLLYLIAWLAIPDRHAALSPAERALRRLRDAPTWLQIGLVVLVGLLFVGGGGFDGRNIALALVLITLGYVLFRQDTRAAFPGGRPPGPPTGARAQLPPAAAAPSPSLPAPPGTAPTEPPAGVQPPAGGWTPPPPAEWAAAPRPARRRSVLGQVTVAAVLVATGVAALMERVGLVDMDGQRYLALALALVGLGLVAGAWWGRARWLIAVGLLLLPVLFAASAVHVPIEGGLGQRRYEPRSLAEVGQSYRLGAGELTVDLSAVRFEPTPRRVAVSLGIGDLTVILPPDVTAQVDGTIRAGEVELFGRQLDDDGPGNDASPVYQTLSPGTDQGGRVELDLDTGIGQVTVRRATG
jgi:phage shock protein PspC (stress-responsive transcriptional regulator)